MYNYSNMVPTIKNTSYANMVLAVSSICASTKHDSRVLIHMTLYYHYTNLTFVCLFVT